MTGAPQTYEGRSGQRWTVRPFKHRPGYLRPSGENGPDRQNVQMVCSEDGDVYGALRVFPDRPARRGALTLLAAGSPTMPVALDTLDDVRLPPAVITSWAAGSSDLPLKAFRSYDDLGRLLDTGHRFTPAQALRTVVALGQLLDTVGERGYTPIELSPDHLVYNRGSIRLVGVGRHLYRPGSGEIPDPCGMSQPTALLIGEDYPGAVAGAAVWRKAQVRALLRLVGWMACGLAPAAWGPVRDDTDLRDYLVGYAGFATMPELHEGTLATSIADAAEREERHEGRQRLSRAKAVVVYDDPACRPHKETRQEWLLTNRGRTFAATVDSVTELNLTVNVGGWRLRVDYRRTRAGRLPEGARINLRDHYREGEQVAVRLDAGGGDEPALVDDEAGSPAPVAGRLPRIRVNPESVRLGLLVEHGPDVIAIAAFSPDDSTKPQATTLSGAGWLLFEPRRLESIVRGLAARLPDTRFVVVGRSVAADSALPPSRAQHIDPEDPRPPVIAGRPATQLPFLDDPQLDDFAKKVAPPGTGQSLSRTGRRRNFVGGWAIAWDSEFPSDARSVLRLLSDQFGNDTELLLRVRLRLNRPLFQRMSFPEIRAKVTNAAPILRGMPPGGLRDRLMAVLLNRTTEDLYATARTRLLPVAPRLAEVYDPDLRIAGETMDDALRHVDGMERLGLFGRLVTALTQQDPQWLADVVSAVDDQLVRALRGVPAPSLQHLAGRIASPDFREVLLRFAGSADLDLLDRYTPAAWEVLLSGTRAPEQLGTLGLGWALVADRDPARAVDPRAVLELAATAGREARHVVRLLLDVPPAAWPAIWQHRRLAATWLREFDSLDLTGLLDTYPGADDLVDNLGARTVRAGHLAGLTADRLRRVAAFARALGRDTDDILTSVLRADVPGAGIDQLTSVAGIDWTRAKLARGASFAECVQRLVQRPERLHTWAVDGTHLARRVMADTFGTELDPATEEHAALFATLGAHPGLVQLLHQLIFPRERLALARLLAAHPRRDRWPVLLGQPVTALLGDHDPGACLDLILTEGLTVGQARAARRLQLDAGDRALLPRLGPPAADLADRDLGTLLAVARRYGMPCAVTTAIIAQRRPQAVAVVAAWGPDWLPFLAGPSADQVIEALASVDLSVVRPREVSTWLITAGTDGLHALRRHGDRLLGVITANRPPVVDVRLVDALLAGDGWPVERLYPLIVRNGLPEPAWPLAAHRLLKNTAESEILLELWCARV